MSEATYWWPSKDQPGTYTIEHHSGAVWRDAHWNGALWSNGHKAVEPLEVLAWGYLGVRREPAAKIANATPKPSKALTPDPDDANAAYAAAVMTRLRAAKKPGEFERIALECVPNLCQMLGAE